MGLTDWFYLTILTCVFIYINNKINRIDLEIRLVFIYSCLISYILTIISAFIAISAFRIFFEVSSHPGIRFFLLCAISTLSFLFFLRVSGKYLYFRNRINLAQYEKYFTIKKFKSYEDISIQINNFYTHNLPKKSKDEFKHILATYYEWYTDRYDKFTELNNTSKYNSGESNLPIYFDYADDLFVFLKLYFKENGYPDLNNKNTDHNYIELDDIQIRKDHQTLHGYLYLVSRHNYKVIAVIDPWRGLSCPNNMIKTKRNIEILSQFLQIIIYIFIIVSMNVFLLKMYEKI